MRFPNRRGRHQQVEQVAIELDLAAQGHVPNDPRVAAASLLQGSPHDVRETARARTEERMMRVFKAAAAERSDDAGTRDEWEVEAHVAEVALPDGAAVRLADVERIDPNRAAHIAREVARVEAERRQGAE